MLKKNDLADESGNVQNIDEAKISAILPMADFHKEILPEAIKNCTESVNEPNERVDKMQSKCNGNAMKFTSCMEKFMSSVCPKEKQAKHPHCKRIRGEKGPGGDPKSDEE